MNECEMSDAYAANRILLSASGPIHDEDGYFDLCGDSFGYYIKRDGTVMTRRDSSNDDVVYIVLANVGPVIISRGKGYPVRYDRNGMPEANTDSFPVNLFYEFCQFQKFKGFQHYESYSKEQLRSLDWLVHSIIARSSVPDWIHLSKSSDRHFAEGTPGVYLKSLVDPSACALHPQPDLVKLFKNVIK